MAQEPTFQELLDRIKAGTLREEKEKEDLEMLNNIFGFYNNK